MLIEKNSTSGPASAVLPPVSVAAPAILPTSSLYPTPAALSRRSSTSGFVRPASAKSSAREATRPTMKPLRLWSTSPAQSAQNPSRNAMFQFPKRRLTGREYSLSSVRPFVLTHRFLPPLSVPRVASSSAAIGKHLHSAFDFRSSAHRGGSDGNSMRDSGAILSSSTNYGQLSPMVSQPRLLTAVTPFWDAGTTPRHNCWPAFSRHHICAGALFSPSPSCPPFSIHAVPDSRSSYPYMYDYLRLPSLPWVIYVCADVIVSTPLYPHALH